MLNYNLALTALNIREYEVSEAAAIRAINAKPVHGSSHLVLAGIMQEKQENVKAILPLYYFLMLEPKTERSAPNLKSLKAMLISGVKEKSANNINLNLSSASLKDTVWGAAEMMLGLTGANRYTDEGRKKTEMEYFIQTTHDLFSFLGEIRKNNTGHWWDLYVSRFNNLVETNNCEAFCYYISQSENSPEIKSWIINNPDKIAAFQEWLKKLN
ncbi:MAG: hypothetical protein HC905_11970 [Bacteroidales bacterium]|nr:hypothetical protein [Bacteroidales bacterium]